MKKDFAQMVFILDRSGSMGGLEPETIKGFNDLVDKQKEKKDDATVTLVLFDDEIETVMDNVPLDKVKPLSEKEYVVRGCTALLDAIGFTIRSVRKQQKAMAKEDRPEKTIVVITTDGMENASRTFDFKKVHELITKMQKEKGWEFLFLGANIDAISTASSLGISAHRAVKYKCDSVGVTINGQVVSEAVMSMREGIALKKDWKKRIEDDVKKRGD